MRSTSRLEGAAEWIDTLCVDPSSQRWVVPPDTQVVSLAAQGFPKYRVTRDGEVIGPRGVLSGHKREARRKSDGSRSGACVRVRLGKSERACQSAHRLVCIAYHGPPPFEGALVRHLNGDPYDNRAENLAWGTNQENSLDTHLHVATDVFKALLEYDDVLCTRTLRAPVRDLIEAAREYVRRINDPTRESACLSEG